MITTILTTPWQSQESLWYLDGLGDAVDNLDIHDDDLGDLVKDLNNLGNAIDNLDDHGDGHNNLEDLDKRGDPDYVLDNLGENLDKLGDPADDLGDLGKDYADPDDTLERSRYHLSTSALSGVVQSLRNIRVRVQMYSLLYCQPVLGKAGWACGGATGGGRGSRVGELWLATW